jgi:hypothetical protein
MAGAELRLLHCKAQAQPFPQRGPEVIGSVPDHHHHRFGEKSVSSVQDVVDERPSRGSMEDLGQRGLHPRSLAGRQDDDVDV